jgi:uncharacterized circularly permuted ATP-grasp superfamily protein
MIRVVPRHVRGRIHVVPEQMIYVSPEHVREMIHVVPEQLIYVVLEQIKDQRNDSCCFGTTDLCFVWGR